MLHNFLFHLDAFHKEFNIDTSPEGRFKKLLVEIVELIEAVQGGTTKQILDEAIDVLVCSIAFTVSLGINNIFTACQMKLERTAAKYRAAGLYDNPKAGL